MAKHDAQYPEKDGRLARWRAGMVALLTVLLIPVALVLGMLLLGYGYIKYHDIRHRPYAVDHRYRFECPTAPDVFPYTSDRPEVAIEMGRYKFIYPAGYGVGFDLPRYKADVRIYDQMQVLYPDMRPVNDPHVKSWQIGANRVFIDIGYHPDGKRHYGIPRTLQKAGRLAQPEPVPALGLVAYRDKLLPRFALKYIPIHEDVMAVSGHPLELECIKTLAYPGPAKGTCDVVFPLRETVWIRYSLFVEYLPCWRQIHDAVYRLTDSFVREND